MSKKLPEYQITIGYKAVITVNVKAANEDEAKKKALAEFEDKFRHGGSNNIDIQDDCYKVDGICNMDNTWRMI